MSRRPEARCDAREPGSDVLPASGWEFAEGGQLVPLAERYQHIADFQMQQRVPWSFGVDAGNLTLPLLVHVQDQLRRYGWWFGV